MMAVIAGLVGFLMINLLTSSIDCDSISNEELRGDCENALSSTWILVALFPIALFFAMFHLFMGRTASFNTLSITNVEERAKKMQKMGVEHILKKTKAVLIDKSKRGNELYELALIPNYPLKYLKYEDPSTAGKTYGCYVPSEINSADAGMAWKFYITEEEYQKDLLYEA
jgi:hypothetical protein